MCKEINKLVQLLHVFFSYFMTHMFRQLINMFIDVFKTPDQNQTVSGHKTKCVLKFLIGILERYVVSVVASAADLD